MKFHKSRTAVSSPIEGIDSYRRAFQAGSLKPVFVRAATSTEVSGLWRRTDISEVNFRDQGSKEPLEVSAVRLKPRAAIVDELTRHRLIEQFFLPITGSIMVVVAASMSEDRARPDPNGIVMVPVTSGEMIQVNRGTWHTLPFSFTGEVLCLSIMHREDLDSYHDVRDLASEGWIGLLDWVD